jgi:hypothetical protein
MLCLDVNIASSEITLKQKSLEFQVLEITNWQLQKKLQQVWLTLEQMSEPSDYPKLPADTGDKRAAHLVRFADRVERVVQLAQDNRDLEFIGEQKRREIFERAQRQSEYPIARRNENGELLNP